jgi:hypothetical protein
VSYATLDAINDDISPSLKAITQTTDFFAYYRLNLFHRVCPFWSDETSMCGNIACAVHTLDNEEDIPEIWRAKELGKLEGPKAEHPGRQQRQERPERPLQGELGADVKESCVVEDDDDCEDRDYCVPEDESATAQGDYVSLVDNPERFTGYQGPGARQVWTAIYRENCFSKRSPALSSSSSSSSSPQQQQQQLHPLGPSRLSPFGQQASRDLKSVMQQHGRQQALASNAPLGVLEDGFEFEDECLEKRVFYRVISGMHASISTHLCWDYLNQTTGRWGPNLACYERRLHSHPEWVANLYFNYALVLRAVAKLRPLLARYTFCSGDVPQDRATQRKVLALADHAVAAAGRHGNAMTPVFDERLMFRDPSASGLKDDFRQRFRNVSRLMDCVGCDKCRLWGKLQTAGYGTALKVLFEFDDAEGNQTTSDSPSLSPSLWSSPSPPSRQQLRRTELVALFNTLDRISSSLSALAKFRAMYQAEHEPAHEGYDAGTAVPPTVKLPPKSSAGVEQQPLNTNNPDGSGLEEDDDDDDDALRQAPLSLREAFWDEWYRVWRAYVYVLKSWTKLPGVM